MGYTHGRMEIDMKVNGNSALSMDKALTFSKMEILILESIKMGNPTVGVSILGRMVPST
jgi:hypothetical protein